MLHFSKKTQSVETRLAEISNIDIYILRWSSTKRVQKFGILCMRGTKPVQPTCYMCRWKKTLNSPF